MRKKHLTQPSLFAAAYVNHEIGRELAAMSGWLDEHPELLDLVAQNIDPDGQSEGERPRWADVRVHSALRHPEAIPAGELS